MNPVDAIGSVLKPGTLSELILERELKTAAQFRGSLARERDRRHVLDLIRTGRDANGHPPSHLVSLPGTGTGLYEQIPIEIQHNAIPRALISQSAPVRHVPPAAGRRRASDRSAWPRPA